MEKLMGLMKKRRNSILVLIGTGSVGSEVPSGSDTLNVMDALAQLNNKKANKLCREVRFYNGENRALDWIARDIYLRIQGYQFGELCPQEPALLLPEDSQRLHGTDELRRDRR